MLGSTKIGSFPSSQGRAVIVFKFEMKRPFSLHDLRLKRCVVFGSLLQLTFVLLLKYCLDLAESHLDHKQYHKN